ncbi:hypothetical protein AB4Y32_00985 [Paraburkholderia phymatum]|uniref:Uncharacterized protein n=1 Tax=Paraburkholderia phymatum TaxID=148447 RepID=A0ACC6TSQ6_9BURK
MTPATLLEELLRYRQAGPSRTANLAALTHDDICRRVEDQIELMLGSFSKYQHISHMVQGPRDQGVDVLLKSVDQEDSPERYVALQIKSYNEIADKTNDLSKDLKSGYFNANDRYDCRLDRYYVLLAGDSRKHAKRLAAITNELAKTENIRVINPRYLLTFIEMPQSTIEAVVDRHLSEDDYVRKEARYEAAGYTAAELYFILACVCWVLENSSDMLPEDFYRQDARMMELAEIYGSEAMDECIQRFSDSDLEVHAEPSSTRLRIEHFPAIRALYYDLQVRYDESPVDLFNHLFQFLNEDFEDEEDDDE